MKPSELLAIARDEYLWNGRVGGKGDKCSFICFAVRSAAFQHRSTTRARYKIQNHIYKLLNGYATYEDWLENTHNVEVKYTQHYTRKVQASRKAWVNDMIRHFEALGE